MASPTAGRLSIQSPTIQQQLASTGVAQLIVVFKPRASVAPLARRFTTSKLSQGAALAAASAPSGKGARHERVRLFPNLGVLYGTADQAALDALSEDEQVASISGAPAFSLIRPTRREQARLADEATWGIKALGAKSLWDEGYTGKGVVVGHLDTGVDAGHPALKGAIAAFAELDAYGGLVKPAPKAYDTGEHGTHTAATIAGRPVRGKSIGVAPEATLASALVIEGGDAVARVLGGLDWALEQGIRVLSMSLGFRGYWEDFLPIIRIVRERGVLPVIAAGNEGPGTSRSPGNYAESLSVGAVDEQRRVAAFSSSQRFKREVDPVVPNLVGPGVDILSARPGGGYQLMDGTSMATPHIAGLAALLIQARPHASVDELEAALLASCSKAGSPSRAGRGMPDGVKALKALGSPNQARQ